MTYLLLSLRRPYTALMLAGKKTLEIRKTAPKAAQTAMPDLRVLLYETRSAALLAWEVAEPVTFPQPLPLTAFGVGCAPQSWRTLDPAAVNAALAKK